MSDKQNGNGLPRLGSTGAPSAKPGKTVTVELEERGVSVVLQKPKVKTIRTLEKKYSAEDADEFEGSVALVAEMLLEPEMSEEELAAEVDDWDLEDWLHLQKEASELAGMGEEAREEARAEFQ